MTEEAKKLHTFLMVIKKVICRLVGHIFYTIFSLIQSVTIVSREGGWGQKCRNLLSKKTTKGEGGRIIKSKK